MTKSLFLSNNVNEEGALGLINGIKKLKQV